MLQQHIIKHFCPITCNQVMEENNKLNCDIKREKKIFLNQKFVLHNLYFITHDIERKHSIFTVKCRIAAVTLVVMNCFILKMMQFIIQIYSLNYILRKKTAHNFIRQQNFRQLSYFWLFGFCFPGVEHTFNVVYYKNIQRLLHLTVQR